MAKFKQNSFYNDPQIGQAFDSLAGLFAPPSGQDALAWSEAGASRQKAQRLQDFYAQTIDPNTPRDAIDRRGIGAGVFSPNQSFFAVDQGNLTSRENNAADNSRELQQTGMQQRGETDRAMLSPVGPGATRFVPQGIADLYGTDPTQTGVVAVQPGEQATLPDGRLISGAPKPLSLDETKARELQAQLATGKITDDQIRAALLSDTPVEQIQTPDGPRIVRRSDAVGQTPIPPRPDLSPIGRAQAELNQLPADDPRRADYENYIRAQGQPRQENAYSAEMGKQFAGQYKTIADAANAARQSQGSLDAMGQALDNPSVVTGAGGELALAGRRAAASLGLGDLQALGDTEVLAAVGNKLALDLRNPAGGAGMPGAMSDADREYLRNMSPGLAQSRTGNRQLIEMQRRVNQRSLDVERLANAYVQQHGQLDAGFQASLSQWANDNPLFPRDPQPQQVAPQPGQPQAGGLRSGVAVTPDQIGGMTMDDLSRLDPSSLNDEQRAAAERRWDALSGGSNGR